MNDSPKLCGGNYIDPERSSVPVEAGVFMRDFHVRNCRHI